MRLRLRRDGTKQERKVPAKTTIIGAGRFGFAWANYLGRLGHNVFLYDSNSDLMSHLLSQRKHPFQFTDVELHGNVRISSSLEDVVDEARLLITSVPSQNIPDIAPKIAEYLSNDTRILNVSKGLIVNETSKKGFDTISEVLDCHIRNYIATMEKPKRPDYSITVLSGPTFASELLSYDPDKIEPLYATIASNSTKASGRIMGYIASEKLILQISKDIRGVEIAGAMKNVVAIVAGIGIGMGYKVSCISGFISAISAEVEQLALKLGADRKTFSTSSFAWEGDLRTSCYGEEGRNRAFGIKIGQGTSVQDALEQMDQENKSVEGKYATEVLYKISQRMKINVPIITETYRVLFESKEPKKAIEDLISGITNRFGY